MRSEMEVSMPDLGVSDTYDGPDEWEWQPAPELALTPQELKEVEELRLIFAEAFVRNIYLLE